MLNKGKIVNFGGTEEVLEVQGEVPLMLKKKKPLSGCDFAGPYTRP